MMVMSGFIKLLALWAFASSACASFALQDPEPAGPVVSCRRCQNTGAIDCGKHGKGAAELEADVLDCSVATACKVCSGALRRDCASCGNDRIERALAQRRQQAGTWLRDRRAVVEAVDPQHLLLHARSEHVDLAYGLKPLAVGRRKLDSHTGMHVYIRRIEELRARFVELLELQEADLPARLQVYMCPEQQMQTLLSPQVTGLGATGAVGTKLMGVEAVYCMWQEPRSVRADDDLHRNLVHNIAHLLVANMTPSQRFGNPGNGWVDEGLAHWFEDAVVGRCANYCFEEILVQPGQLYEGGYWRLAVRRLLDQGQLVSLASIAPKNTDQLTFPEHAQAFAYVDHLITVHGGAKFRDFVRRLKQKEPMRDSLTAVYGQNPLAFDETFREWVRQNYSPREKR